MMTITDKSGVISERCFKDFPNECVGCEFYNKRISERFSLAAMIPFFVQYESIPKVIEICTKYHKTKTSM